MYEKEFDYEENINYEDKSIHSHIFQLDHIIFENAFHSDHLIDILLRLYIILLLKNNSAKTLNYKGRACLRKTIFRTKIIL